MEKLGGDPIPQSLADALGRMILSYAAGDWTPAGGDDLRVTIDRAYHSYEWACSLFENFSDPLPADLLHRLLGSIHHGDEDLIRELAAKGSYSSAARTLRLLMQRRKAAYRRLEEIRRSR
jgi:hypothetical protein